MKPIVNLSHSAKGKLDHCPRMYQLHYIDKIRPDGTTSSLLFGSAIDAAAESYLQFGDKKLSRDKFVEKWKQQEINGKLVDLKTCTEIQFHPNDFDHELLTESDNQLIIKDTIYETVTDLVEAGVDKEKITLANWVSLYRKGLILIRDLMNWIDNNLAEVLEIQSAIELESAPYLKINEAGEEVEVFDMINGKADFVVKMQDYDVPLLVDLKTAARYYARDSVSTSEQLALYYFYLKNSKYPEMQRAAYLVLQKNIKKNRVKTCKTCGFVTEGKEQKCAVEIMVQGKRGLKKGRCNGEFDVQITPEATIQFIHDEIPQNFIDETIAKFDNAIAKIKSNVFEKNLDGCHSYYGKPCPYLNYCENGCMDGLIKKEEK